MGANTKRMQKAQAKVWCRIPLVGGFTDHPEFYKLHDAATVCCAINRYISVSIQENAVGGVDIRSASDLPWGLGLGSSGAYYAALVSALARYKQQTLPKSAVARLAYQLENGIEDHSTGRQDSVACLFRGISMIIYFRDDSVAVNPIPTPIAWRSILAKRLLLFDIGERRRARDSIRDASARNNKSALLSISKLPGLLIRAWEHGDFDFLADALNVQEQYRSQLSPLCKSARTDRLLRIARGCGAGARLTGAGLGCLLCYCPEERQATRLRQEIGLREIEFSILW